MQTVPLFIGRWKLGFAIFFISGGGGPFFRQIGDRSHEEFEPSDSGQHRSARLGPVGRVGPAKDALRAGYGGSFEKTIRDEVIPTFEKENGVKVEYVAGNSTDSLAKLQAQKGNQQIDVAIVDDGPMYQAIQLGFCGKLDGLPADLYDTARFKDDRAVAIGIVATGLMYNTKVFAEKGWAPPTSWNDLKDTKYAKQLVIPPINNTYGLEALVMLSKMNGGGETNVDSGFKIFKEQINPNVLAYEPSPGKMTELFQSGQAVIAVWGTGRVQSFANTGFPVDFVYPKEGAATLLTTACPVTKPNASPLASSFVKMLLE